MSLIGFMSFFCRIEQVILDLAKNYYVAQAKSVKAHKDQLNKTTQIYLYIRHEFKLGFLHEIRQIYNTALGYARFVIDDHDQIQNFFPPSGTTKTHMPH